jgi:glc operon protein GlcG
VSSVNQRAQGATVAEHADAATLRPSITMAAAERMLDAAVREARAMTIAVTVVAVDSSGVQMAMRRMDGAPLVSVQTALNKAYAAAALGMPPDDFYSAIQDDAAAVAEFATRPGLALMAGGLPVVAAGEVAGAVGVAGAMTAADDRRIAELAARAATRR